VGGTKVLTVSLSSSTEDLAAAPQTLTIRVLPPLSRVNRTSTAWSTCRTPTHVRERERERDKSERARARERGKEK
jgi:hypothetical protein